jgi:hypothetical protein
VLDEIWIDQVSDAALPAPIISSRPDFAGHVWSVRSDIV